MLLALYCPDERYRTRIESAVPDGRTEQSVTEWRQFERTASAAECSVVLIPWLPLAPAVEGLTDFKSRHPQHPVVLVTRADIQNARHLKDVPVEEVVWLEEVPQELSSAVSRTCLRSHARELCEGLQQAPHLASKLREALVRACASERPIRTVDRLASMVGCDRRTLWHQWRQAVEGGPSLRLQDFLHWLILLRAVERKAHGGSCVAVAREVGLHVDTLTRLARQYTGQTFREVAAHGQMALLDRFREEVLPRVIGTPADKPT